MPRDFADEPKRARHAAAAVDEDRAEETHQVRAARVAHGLQMRVADLDRGADRDPLREVDLRTARARAEDHLRVRAQPLADARAAELVAEQQPQRAENTGGE